MMLIGKEIVQTVYRHRQTVRPRRCQMGVAGFGFLVGIGVDDQHGFLRICGGIGKSLFLMPHIGAVGGGEGFKIKLIAALAVGEGGVVVYQHDVCIVKPLSELFGGLGGEKRFARTFVAAQEEEGVHDLLVCKSLQVYDYTIICFLIGLCEA